MDDHHCSDETLVALLDGELPARLERSVRNHMSACWACRGRAAELEQQMHAVSRAEEYNEYPGTDWVIESRLKFAEARRKFDQAPVTRFRRATFRWAFALAAGVVLVIAAATISFYLRSPAPAARELLTRTVQKETEVWTRPVHISSRVEIAELQPVRRSRVSRLEVWSDAARSRLTSRWTGPDGSLQYARWMPSRGSEFAYDPSAKHVTRVADESPRSQTSFWEIPAGGLDADRIAAGLSRWLAGRRWRPISFAPDLVGFVSEDGVLLRSERKESEGGTVLQLVARRQQGAVTAEVTLDLDPVTYRPRMERVRFETSGRAIEIRLIREKEETFESTDIIPAVFHPPVEVAPSPAPVPDAIAQTPALDRSELVLDALVVLHDLNACRGESVEVVDEPDGTVVVRGVVSSPARKQELVSALHSFAPPLRVQLSSLQEATAETSSAVVTRLAPIANSGFPAEEQLRKTFGNDEAVARFASQAASDSTRLLTEAWALRHLEERYATVAASLSPALKAKLARMLNDHSSSIETQGSSLVELIVPTLEIRSPEAQTEAAAAASWPEAVMRSFQLAEKIHDRSQYLFAGASLRLGTEQKPSEAAADLFRDLKQLIAAAHQTRTQIARDLTVGQ